MSRRPSRDTFRNRGGCAVWDELSKQINVEREQLRQLIETHRALLEKCSRASPDAIELSALAALLHAFYTRIENIFKRVAIAVEGAAPRGDVWHRDLLDSMTCPRPNRQAVISDELSQQLSEYLAFRHVFRQAYTFQLQWEKMTHLVLECETVLIRLEAELDSFLESGESKAT